MIANEGDSGRGGGGMAGERAALAAAIIASAMGFIDGSLVALAMPAIRADLGADLVAAQWIANSYMLALSAFVLPGGAAGDVFGIRSGFALGGLGFVGASLACAAAPDAATLIAMRGVQGLAAALMVPASLSLVATRFPPERRGQAIGTWAAFSALTTALGPVIAGLALSAGDDTVWRALFAVNLPAGAAVLLLLRAVPGDRPSHDRRPDLVGAVLAALALGLIAYGLTEFGLPPARRSLPPVFTLGFGGATFALFLVHQWRAAQPMMPLGLFADRSFAGITAYTLLQYAGFGAVAFFLGMSLIAGWDVPEWQAALASLPIAVMVFALGRFAGTLADRVGPRLPLAGGALLTAIGCGLLAATFPWHRLWSATVPSMIVAGAGMGLLVGPLSSAAMQAAPGAEAGVASGINNAVARVASLLAVALFGALAAQVHGRAGGDGQFGAPGHAAASDAAFAVIAYGAMALCVAAAAVAWLTQAKRT